MSCYEERWTQMSRCETLWTQYVPVLGTVDLVYASVRSCGPVCPQSEELWTQYMLV